jgi:hypothetical protein
MDLMEAITPGSVGDLASLMPSFERYLRATDKSPQTITAAGEAANQLLDFLRESGVPTEAT